MDLGEPPNTTALRSASIAAIGLLLVLSACAGGQSASQKPISPTATSSAPSQPTAAVTTTSTSTPPAEVTLKGNIEDWATYGGTEYTGCVSKFGDGRSTNPEIFDTKSGKLMKPADPPLDRGATLTGVSCTLTGTPDDLKLVDIFTQTTPAQGLQPQVDKTMAYVFDIGGIKPLVSADISEVTKVQSIAGTATGVVIDSGLGTTVLSNRDLSTLWTDPQSPACVTPDAVAFSRKNVDYKIDTGIEVRAASGESILKDPNVPFGCKQVLYDNADHLIRFVKLDPSSDHYIDGFFNVDTRAYLDTDDFMRHLADATTTISNGQIFVTVSSSASELGMRVWNVKTGQVEFSKSNQEYDAAAIYRAFFFGNHLYLVNSINGSDMNFNFSVNTVPDEKQIATRWTNRPIIELNGWTVALTGTSDQTGDDCRVGSGPVTACTVRLIKDQRSTYPGPWT
jgi:hypothetical protein